MQDQLKPITSPDGLFHDGNPATGELGTIVTSDWLNGVQSAVQSTQQELLSVLKSSGQTPDPARKDQLLQAVQNIAWGGTTKPSTLAGYGITDAASKIDLKAAVDGLVAGAPGALNTLQELAAALGNDSNFAASIAKLLAGKADRASTLAGYGITDALTQTVNADAVASLDAIATSGTTAYNSSTSGAPTQYGVVLTVSNVNPIPPVGSSGSVWVTQTAYGTDGTRWMRHRVNNGGWLPWSQMAFSDSVASAAPAGMVAYFAMPTAPAGWLIADGKSYPCKDYPSLSAALKNLYGGDGVTTFAVPNLCGEFIRGWNAGRNVDAPDRGFGSLQLDAFQGHRHNNAQIWSTGAGITFPSVGANSAVQISVDATDGTITGGSGTPRVATETRPRNIALLACIKY
ncbi:phage tail protein [Chromobacterium sp. ASV23]|uniref:phage tail protein n=1 Tax=Chromobacterium sp. ASV23 TaxID=2795110 RepID=UPI0018EE3B32|nr:phage tail protein [Chromobacterium sp. ASV23]